MNTVYLLLGSNIDKETNLPRAIALLQTWAEVTAVSPTYETPPVGLLGQESFYNAVVCLRTPLRPAAIKRELIGRLEQTLHRVRQADKNAPRTIDADILLFNDEVLEYDGRLIPDPDLLRFAHAAVPLAALAPTLPHPQTGEPMADIAARLAKEVDGLRLVQPSG